MHTCSVSVLAQVLTVFNLALRVCWSCVFEKSTSTDPVGSDPAEPDTLQKIVFSRLVAERPDGDHRRKGCAAIGRS